MNSQQQELKKLFLDTMNPNTNIRNTAEQTLNECVKNVDVLKCIHEEIVKDDNLMVRKASGIFLVNKLTELYDEECIRQFILYFEQNVFEHVIYAKNKHESEIYENLLKMFYTKAKDEKVKYIATQIGESFSQPDIEKVKAAFIGVAMLFKAECYGSVLKHSLDIIFGTYGQAFGNALKNVIQSENWTLAHQGMKSVHRAYALYNIPSALCEISVFNFYIEQALNLTKLKKYEDDEFIKTKKWAYAFLYNITKKACKKYFKKNDMSKHVQNDTFMVGVANIFMEVVDEYKSNTVPIDQYLAYTAQFFDVMSSCKDTKNIFGNYVQKLLYDFIIPCFKYDDSTEMLFEGDQVGYLSERYNFSSKLIRATISTLFYSIIKHNKAYESHLVGILVQLYNDSNTDVKVKYGLLGLMAEVTTQMHKVLGEQNFYNFCVNTLKTILLNGPAFMVSQAFFFMNLCTEVNLKKDDFHSLMQLVFKFTQNENIALQVESTLAMQFFFDSEQCKKQLEAVIPGLLETVLKYNKLYPSESLSSFMEYIVEMFDDVVVDFAPRFAATIVSSINDILGTDDPDYYQISTYITSIDKFVVASSDRPPILKSLYDVAIGMIYTIFKNNTYEIYEETLDLMNTFLFALETVDERAYEIFKEVVKTDPDELCMYPEELEIFFDNYISYGGEKMVNLEVLAAFQKIFTLFYSSAEEDGIYAEDCIVACNIINALLIYAGKSVVNCDNTFIPKIVNQVLASMTNVLSEKILCIVSVLDLLMNCVVVDPVGSFNAIGGYKKKFLEKIWENSYNFKRVIDKKIYLLFIKTLYQFNADESINYTEMNKSFVHVFTTLPAAIQKRNKLIEDEDLDEMEEDDDAFEDVNTYTAYDEIDAYEMVKGMLSAPTPGSVGQNALSKMGQQEISAIQVILCNPQEKQKLRPGQSN